VSLRVEMCVITTEVKNLAGPSPRKTPVITAESTRGRETGTAPGPAREKFTARRGALPAEDSRERARVDTRRRALPGKMCVKTTEIKNLAVISRVGR
jgi:hypothetical protein